MNKNQISKILRYFFVEKQYGIKEMDQHAIWLLKMDSEYPIVCISLQKEKESYYKEKWLTYKSLLDVEKPLLLINVSDISQYDFVYQNIEEETDLKQLFSSEQFQKEYPDYLLSMLQSRFKYPKGFFRFSTMIIISISLLIYFLANHVLQTNVGFLLGGYFRFGIIEMQLYRLITSIFHTNHLILLWVYALILYQSEYSFSLQHSRKKFLLTIILTTLFSNVLLVISQVEVIGSGLSASIACLTMLSLSKVLLVWKMQASPIKTLITRIHLFKLLTMIWLFVVDFYPALYGSIFALLLLYYIKVKEQKSLLVHYFIAMSVLFGGISFLFVRSFSQTSIHQDVARAIIQEKQSQQSSIFKDLIEKVEYQYGK